MRILIIISLTLIISGCNYNSTSISTVPKKSETCTLFTKSSYSIVKDDENLNQYKLDSGKNLVFIYKKEGVTFIDASNYEVNYTEALLFDFDPTLVDFEYSDKELSKINCQYSWLALSKLPIKKNKVIEKGKISGNKINSDTWLIKIEIDTDNNFGGYLSGQSTSKIKIEREIKTTNR